jgi:SAM-dependent methyltransferase
VPELTAGQGAGPFQVIEHVAFEELVLTVGGQRHDDVVFNHWAAFAAWGPVVVELGQVHAIDDRLAAAYGVAPGGYGVAPGAVSHVSWVGLTLVLAAQRGAAPSGLDISPGLLGLARERLPDADLREGDMEDLPFGDAAFDAVVGVNAFQFAGDPRRALREAARVVRPNGRVVASLFAAPERAEGTVVHEAMSALVPPEHTDDHAPYALSAPGNLEAALAGAGLRLISNGEVVCCWRYASMDDAVRGPLCSAGGARAIQAAGEHAVRDVLKRALAQFRDPKTGVVTLRNTFRWVAARR